MRYATTMNETLRTGKTPQRPTEGQSTSPAEDQKARARALFDQLRADTASYERAVKGNKKELARIFEDKIKRQREELREMLGKD